MQQKRAAAVWRRGGGHSVKVDERLEQASGGRSAEQASGGGRSVEEGVFTRA